MKKIILITAISTLVLASCKKDYTCDCTSDSGKIVLVLENSSKSDAEDTCNSVNSEFTCELK